MDITIKTRKMRLENTVSAEILQILKQLEKIQVKRVVWVSTPQEILPFLYLFLRATVKNRIDFKIAVIFSLCPVQVTYIVDYVSLCFVF